MKIIFVLCLVISCNSKHGGQGPNKIRDDTCNDLLPDDLFNVEIPSYELTNILSILPSKSLPIPDIMTYIESDTSIRTLRLQESSSLDITLISSNGNGINTFGYLVLDDQNDIISNEVIFSNTAFSKKGCMQSGDTLTIGPFNSDTNLGFYVDIGQDASERITTQSSVLQLDTTQHFAVYHEIESNKFIFGINAKLSDTRRNFADIIISVSTENIANVVNTTDMLQLIGTTIADTFSECNSNSDDQITNIFKFDGFEYALLDNSDPLDSLIGCQTSLIKVPSGWRIAENVPSTRSIVSINPWSTKCIGLQDGTFLSTDELITCDIEIVQVDNCVRVSKCPARILIVKDGIDPENIMKNRAMSEELNNELETGLWEEWDEYPSLTNSWSFTQEGLPSPGELDPEPSVSVEGAIRTNNPSEGRMSIVMLRINATEIETIDGFQISVWSKIVRITDPHAVVYPSDYSLYVDIEYNDDGESIFEYGIYVPFQADADKDVWFRRLMSIYPRRDIELVEIKVYFVFRSYEGVVLFTAPDIGPITDANLIQNPYFDLDTSNNNARALNWNSFRGSYSVESGQAIIDVSSATDSFTGIEQIITIPNVEDVNTAYSHRIWDNIQCIYVGATAKYIPEDDPTSDAQTPVGFLHLDAYYSRNKHTYGLALNVGNPPPLESTYFDTIFELQVKGNRVLTSLNVVPLAVLPNFNQAIKRPNNQDTIDAVYEGDIAFEQVITRPIPCPANVQTPGTSYGDPHIEMLPDPNDYYSSTKYDFQSVGEFVLASDNIFDVHIRTKQVSSASIVIGVGIQLNGTGAVFIGTKYNYDLPLLVINGAMIEYSSNDTIIVNGISYEDDIIQGSVQITGDLSDYSNGLHFTIRYGNTEYLTNINVYTVIPDIESDEYQQFINVHVGFPESSSGSIVGLLGPMSSNVPDLRDLDGESIYPNYIENVTYSNLYSDLYELFGTATKVPVDLINALPIDSALYYALGENSSTYSTPEFPTCQEDLMIETYYNDEEIQEATEVCETAIGNIDDDVLMDACITDVLCMNSESIGFGMYRNIALSSSTAMFISPVMTERRLTVIGILIIVGLFACLMIAFGCLLYKTGRLGPKLGARIRRTKATSVAISFNQPPFNEIIPQSQTGLVTIVDKLPTPDDQQELQQIAK
jgi:hypothetical protein